MCKKNYDKYIENQRQKETPKSFVNDKIPSFSNNLCISEEQKDAEALTRETGRKEMTIKLKNTSKENHDNPKENNEEISFETLQNILLFRKRR